VPLAASGPLQPPEATQASASVVLQVSKELPPRATALGEAVSVAVGNGFTVTAALTGALVPPGPVHVSAKFALPLKGPLLWLPLGASVPPQLPEALQEAALVELHVSVTDSPASIVVSDAVNETVGTGVGVVAPPPQADSNISSAMLGRQ
jgi:hypothetical protein